MENVALVEELMVGLLELETPAPEGKTNNSYHQVISSLTSTAVKLSTKCQTYFLKLQQKKAEILEPELP